MVKYYSDAKINFGGAGKEGATISSVKATCGAKSTKTDGGILSDVESGQFVLTATDSRGATVSQTINRTLIEYIKPTCNQHLRMVLESESSAQVNLTVTGNYFNASFGAKSNTLKIYTRHSHNGGAWSDWGDISVLISDISDNTYTLNADISGLDPSGIYTFQCKAVDALGEAITSEHTVKLLPVFDWGKTDFNFNVPITIEGNPLVDFVIEEGTESMGSNGTWYWRKWASGRADCYGCRNYGNMAITTAWGSLYRSGAFTQSFPSGLFSKTPEVIDITFRGGSNVGGWIANHENSAPSASATGSFILVRPASATLTGSYLSFNAIGRWKE
jgi:hypothetical protein